MCDLTLRFWVETLMKEKRGTAERMNDCKGSVAAKVGFVLRRSGSGKEGRHCGKANTLIGYELN